MAYEIKENTGSIFKNEYKKDNEKAPDYKGKANIDGKTKDISCWINETKDGKKYFAVKFSDEYVKEQKEEPSDLPF